MQTQVAPCRAVAEPVDFRPSILLCSNEPKISEELMIGSLDKATRLLAFRSQERDALRIALHDHLIVGAIFDLNYCDESILEIIGQTQKACKNNPLICISGRQLTGHTLSQSNRTFYYAHSRVPAFALRKMLQQPPLPEPMQFQGVLQTRSLSEVVQLLLFACLSGRLSVVSDTQRGELQVHRGQIVHAECGGRQGYAAALSLLEWTRGNFRFHQGRPSAQTMQLGPHHPLFDPSRRTPTADAEAETTSKSGPHAVLESKPVRSSATPEVSVHADPLHGSAKSHRSPAPASTLIPTASDQAASHRSPTALPSAMSHRSPVVVFPTIVVSAAVTPTPISNTSDPAPVAEAIAEYHRESLEDLVESAPCSEETPAHSELTLELKDEHGIETIKQSWLELDTAETHEPAHHNQEDPMAVTANSVKEVLSKLELTIEGFIGAAVADSDSGMCIGSTGGAGVMNIEVAAAANTEVVRAKRKAMKTLNLRDEIEDILITLGKHYHLIRPLRSRPQLFMYIAVDRSRANLAMARFALADAERDLGV